MGYGSANLEPVNKPVATKPAGGSGKAAEYALPTAGKPAGGGYYDPTSGTYRAKQGSGLLSPTQTVGGGKTSSGTRYFGNTSPTPPQPTALPANPIDFSGMFNSIFGGGGAGGGGSTVGGVPGESGEYGGYNPGGGSAPPTPAESTGKFVGSPSSYMDEVYRKAMEQYATAPDMVDRNLVLGRDATTQAMREVQGGLTGRLGAGFAAPGAASRISDAAARNLNAGMADASQQKFDMQMDALGLGGSMGQGIAGDLRAQEGMGINAYNAQTNAWQAAQQANYQQQKLKLDAQLAQMQMAMGFLTPFLNMYSNMYSSYGRG